MSTAAGHPTLTAAWLVVVRLLSGRRASEGWPSTGREHSPGEQHAIDTHRGEIVVLEIHRGRTKADMIVARLRDGTAVPYSADGREIAGTSTNGERT